MAAVIGLPTDFEGTERRRLARCSGDANQTRRLPVLAVVHDGGRRSEAAVVGGVTLLIVRDWVLRFRTVAVSHRPGGDNRED